MTESYALTAAVRACLVMTAREASWIRLLRLPPSRHRNNSGTRKTVLWISPNKGTSRISGVMPSTEGSRLPLPPADGLMPWQKQALITVPKSGATFPTPPNTEDGED